MSSPIWNFFHLTTYEAMAKILDGAGIDPAFTQGRRHVSWYVTRKLVTWAMPHVCQRHQVELSQVCILRCKIEITKMAKTSHAGVYCTDQIFYPVTVDSAEIWLQHEEKLVFVKGTRTRPGKWYGRAAH
jgi:hypothetical protein